MDRALVVPGLCVVGPPGLRFAVNICFARGLLPDRHHDDTDVDQSGAAMPCADLPQISTRASDALGVGRHNRLLRDTRPFFSPSGSFFAQVATFSRDTTPGSLKGVKIAVTMALDFIVLAPKQTSWDTANLNPPSVFECPRDITIPLARGSDATGRAARASFTSRVTDEFSTRLVVLTACETDLDWQPASECDEGRSDVPAHWGTPPTTPTHRRAAPCVDDRGFRLKTVSVLLVPVLDMDTRVFSLTQFGATPNKGSLTGRSTRHSEELCTEVLSRSRTIDDYVHILRKTRHQGSNDPGFYTVHLRHVGFRALSRGGLAAFVKRLKAERERLPAWKRQERRYGIASYDDDLLSHTIRAHWLSVKVCLRIGARN